jgi:hypothetical protein
VRYSKVSRRLWGSEDFRSLSSSKPSARELWLYLLTCPEQGVIPGIFRAFEGGIADQLGWSVVALREYWGECSAKGMARADWRAGLVVIPRAFFHNPPASPNHLHGWREEWDELPDCELKSEYFHTLKGYVHGLGKPWVDGWGKYWGEYYPKHCRPQEQDQEQDQEQEQEQEQTNRSVPQAAAPLVLVSSEPTSDPAATVFAAYLDARKRHRPKGSVPVLTDDRRKLVARWLKSYPVETLSAAAAGIWLSPFHRGENDRGNTYTDFETALKSAKNIEKFASGGVGNSTDEESLTIDDIMAAGGYIGPNGIAK